MRLIQSGVTLESSFCQGAAWGAVCSIHPNAWLALHLKPGRLWTTCTSNDHCGSTAWHTTQSLAWCTGRSAAKSLNQEIPMNFVPAPVWEISPRIIGQWLQTCPGPLLRSVLVFNPQSRKTLRLVQTVGKSIRPKLLNQVSRSGQRVSVCAVGHRGAVASSTVPSLTQVRRTGSGRDF